MKKPELSSVIPEFRESRFFFVFSWIPALSCTRPLGRNDVLKYCVNVETPHWIRALLHHRRLK
jgi:hypothetical protein